MNTPDSKRAEHTAATPTRKITLPRLFTRAWIETNSLSSHIPEESLVLDFSGVEKMDTAGASLVYLLNERFIEAGKELKLIDVSPHIMTMLETCRIPPRTPDSKTSSLKTLFCTVGDKVIEGYAVAVEALSMLAEMIYWGTIGLLKRRDFRKGVLGEQMFLLGHKAIGIVGLLAFLIGIVLSLQTAIQLRLYGANIFLAPMIGISMIRELGPLMTAIILAGRTGSATTAEIATMGVGEELDALKTMGINPIQFVVVPKFWAITLTMPMLNILATVTGIIGGYLIAIVYLDISSSLFWSELVKNIYFKDVFAGFLKSVVFSWLIIWIGAFFGFKVRGGAEAVGKETTASVVTCIFIIIVADALFSFMP
jgi:phospholipid/cholesterol/gamma-HCH transport system permease protein